MSASYSKYKSFSNLTFKMSQGIALRVIYWLH
jgi:hypothetical protein